MLMRPESRELDKIYKRRDRYEIPDWQREEVWPKEKKQLLSTQSFEAGVSLSSTSSKCLRTQTSLRSSTDNSV